MVKAKSSDPINQSYCEKRMENKVIMIENSNSSHPINPKSDREERMEEKVIMIEKPNSSHPINQKSDREERMEEKVIMIEKPNSSHPINQKRSDGYRIGIVGMFSMVLCLTVIMFPIVKADVAEEHHTSMTVLVIVYVFLFQVVIGGATLDHPVNNTIFDVLYMLLFTSAVTIIASTLVSQTAGIIILILWVHMIGNAVNHNWQVISSVDLEESKRFRKFIAIICVISLLFNINSTVNYFSNIFYT